MRNLNIHIHPTANSQVESSLGGVQGKKEKALFFNFQTQFLELFLEPDA